MLYYFVMTFEIKIYCNIVMESNNLTQKSYHLVHGIVKAAQVDKHDTLMSLGKFGLYLRQDLIYTSHKN